MKQAKHSGSLMLLIASVIWGSAFVAQSMGMDFIQPFTFQALRTFLGALALTPLIIVRARLKKAKNPQNAQKTSLKPLLLGGFLCGLTLFVANNLQQFGLVETTAGKAGFLTALYIIVVPLYGLFLKHRPRPAIWVSVLIAAIGLYLLSVTEQFTISRGDLLLIICAFFYAGQILLVDHFAVKVDGVQLCALQLIVCSLFSGLAMFIFEQPDKTAILRSMGPLLYSGVLSSGVAFTLQILAQRTTPPAVASLLMSLEAVFAVLTGWLILGEVLSLRETIGSLMMFAAIIFAQRASLPKEQTA